MTYSNNHFSVIRISVVPHILLCIKFQNYAALKRQT